MAIESPEPEGRADERAGLREERRALRSGWLGTGSLSCPECDAPTPLVTIPAAPTTVLGCPYCEHTGPLHEFLSLQAPHRAPRVNVWVRRAPLFA